MDQVTASVEMIHEGNLCVLTTRYLSECGCEWVVDMWGNVRRVKICPRDTNDIRWEDQLDFNFCLEDFETDEETLEREERHWAFYHEAPEDPPGPAWIH